VYPEDLEAALRRQPEVKDCVVVGMERGGNAEPCAVVILRGGGNADTRYEEAKLEAVVQRANESLADYQRMRMWVEWPEQDFPRTNTQKPRRSVIANIARESPLLAQKAREKWGTRREISPHSSLIYTQSLLHLDPER